MIKKLYNKTTPIACLSSGSLVCYKYGKFIVRGQNGELKSYSVFNNFRESILARSKLLFRFFRLGVRTSELVDDDILVFCVGRTIYEYDFRSEKLSKGYYCGDGIRPLIFTNVKNITGVEDGLYFGGYMGNPSNEPVSIYRRLATDKWKVEYTFPKGAINHVHNIVSDPYRDCLWIFTGDFGEASAIWQVSGGFGQIKKVLGGSQDYRGCVVFATEEGLLYATDAPFTSNSIYCLDTKSLEISRIVDIAGSCIYGCKWIDEFVFSSTVEGDGRNNTFLKFLFDRKRGAGIKDDYVHLYVGNLSNGFREIYKEKKDRMPFYTFQFGVFRFPCGENVTNQLYFQSIATKRNDLAMMSYSQENREGEVKQRKKI